MRSQTSSLNAAFTTTCSCKVVTRVYTCLPAPHNWIVAHPWGPQIWGRDDHNYCCMPVLRRWRVCMSKSEVSLILCQFPPSVFVCDCANIQPIHLTTQMTPRSKTWNLDASSKGFKERFCTVQISWVRPCVVIAEVCDGRLTICS